MVAYGYLQQRRRFPGLLSSLEAGLEGIPRFEVIVVDNGSRDDFVEHLVALPNPT